ncbi:MAG: hydrogenase maturation protein HypF [Gaiellales bacterium]|nr:hydrogenase maturation protein HypF [Gaiellales bacterium]
MSAARVRARVQGVVQGVGFRPFVYRLAREEQLGGFVLNDERGVVLEVDGSSDHVLSFLARLARESPPLAVVERDDCNPLVSTGEREFRIVESVRSGEADALVAPDAATCDDCLAELRDPRDRRFRYPFVNCTNCGPRFTIVRGVPYDRPATTMAGFAMCAACQAEYDDPGDRRFHAQPNACSACGPRARLLDRDGEPLHLPDSGDAIRAAAHLLAGGAVLAIKGIGGYHLACAAADEHAVRELRARKRREDRPFALMARDLAAAGALAELGQAELALLATSARPIVLAPRRRGAQVADAVAPGMPELGLMLPYAPLHHLLLDDLAELGAGAIVLTSGNVSDEPIAFRDRDARQRLAGIADATLIHDRPIETRTDDSLVRAVSVRGDRRPSMLRRSRGYVPASIDLPFAAPRPLLACGGQLKATFCLARGRRAWVSHHIGDLQHYPALLAYRQGIEHFERLFALRPELIAYDLHPGYSSTAYALEREGCEATGVQHHHAHLAACLAEHGVEGPAIGAIYDGSGYGTDGTVWGGEVLVGDLAGFERFASLRRVRMPGGAAAIHEPWRMACSWLASAYGEGAALPVALAGDVDAARWRQVSGIAASTAVSPETSSMGRLFDAVAALCGVRARVSYESQAAVELEAVAAGAPSGGYELPLIEENGRRELDPRDAIRAIASDVSAGVPVATVAARFHEGIALATARACVDAAERHGVELVVLSGGVFQNRTLLERTAALLTAAGLHPLVPERLPPNDGGIAYGQAAVAAARDRAGALGHEGR